MQSGALGMPASVVAALGLSCGIFPDQELNPCPLYWQADFYSLHHQESPILAFSACGHKGSDTTEAIKHTWPHVNTREGMPQLRDDDVL